MPIKASYVTPMLHVDDVERSLRFYALLGFETIDVEPDEGPVLWARVHCEGGALMFLRTEEPAEKGGDRFFLYLYTEDLPALRAQLVEAGLEAGPIERPVHAPAGEMCLQDPDGYLVLIGHWSAKEHEEWERGRERKRASGRIP